MSQNPTSLLVLQLSDNDLNAIKIMDSLAVTSINETYLAATSDTVTDMAGTSLVPISVDDALRASDHMEDINPPALVNFTLDLNTGFLRLTFNETVVTSSFNFTSAVLQSDAMRDSETAFLRLQNGTLISPAFSPIVEFYLSSADQNILNADNRIALSEQNTFIVIDEGIVIDTRGYLSVPILSSSALQAAMFFIDGTRPTLIGFDLDLDSNVLTLSFSELVTASSFNSPFFTLQNSQTDPTYSYQLQDSAPSTTGENNTLIVPLSVNDTIGIKSLTDLATRENNTFLAARLGGVEDIYLNPLEPVVASNATMVAEYVPDTTSPRLISFSLNLDSGLIIFYLTEPVDLESFNFSHIVLANGNGSDASDSYPLTGGTVSQDNLQVTLDLADDDEVALKESTTLATSTDDTFITITSFAFTDGAGMMVTGIPPNNALQASNVVIDMSPPTLVSFRYEAPSDRPGIVVSLEFSEVINITTLNVSELTLQSAASIMNAAQTYILSDPDLPSSHVQTVNINVSQSDFLMLQSLAPLGTTIDTTYIAIARGAVLDIVGRPIAEIPTTNARRADAHSVDLVSPRF